ncbi:unnamed protein product [Nippostrongylus brasiliensis]|uniref:Long-chain-fatty-acid--CoA ligase 1 n=1 Tax=Nippostrongylus brasiliensis TaxID=27835 RepID=A0A0N4XSF5_NIPBR|nr:unnamed protein product [Nippostrongylus brasiliensis]
MDGDAPQPSTSHSSEAKDPTRSKLDRLVKKVGRKLLPKSGENIFVPSTMSPYVVHLLNATCMLVEGGYSLNTYQFQTLLNELHHPVAVTLNT